MAIFVDDKELLAAHKAGNSDAFDELVREYRQTLFRQATRRLSCEAAAEDAVQETLVRAYKALPNFSGEYRLGAWLYRIMENVCVDEANRRKRELDKNIRVAALPNLRDSAPSVEDELGLQVDTSNLGEALQNLSEPYRDALTMRFVKEMDYKEVADVSGLSEQNARARVSRARSAMKIALKGLAFVPVMLWGLLHRGEKAAAAATSTGSLGTATIAGSAGGVAATSTISTVATSSMPLVSGILPAVAESVISAGPAVVPVVAKAAVGLGIVAAVFAPASDSAVHQAVDQITDDSALEVVINEDSGLLSGQSQVIVVDTEPKVVPGSGVDQSSSALALPETLSPSIPGAVSTAESIVVSTKVNETPAALVASGNIDGPGGIFTVPTLRIVSSGADRYSLSGDVSLVIDGVTKLGVLDSASRLKVVSTADPDGQRRLDALLFVELLDKSSLEFRLAGMINETQDLRSLAGLFRSVSSGVGFVSQGSFTGSAMLDFASQSGSLEVILSS